MVIAPELARKAGAIRLLLSDVDGVLTDSGVYYSAQGEALKRFSIRDGMGVERLRTLANVDVGIITGERSEAVRQRAAKLAITELHLGIRNKLAVVKQICRERGLPLHALAYIGDDANDTAVMQVVGLAAAPRDATRFALNAADYVCEQRGGHGAFRDFAELIIAAQTARRTDNGRLTTISIPQEESTH